MHTTKHPSLLAGAALIFLLLAGCARTRTVSPPAASAIPTLTETTSPARESSFRGLDGAFVLYDRNAGTYLRHNPERCAERLLPASTFKILNALIGLESGVIPDEHYVIPWDGTQYEVASWNQDHTLKTAMQNSVVWYYQELARRVGREQMQHYIDAVGYGDRDISGGIDTFWLDGSLQISADEQVELLKSLYEGNLPFSARSMQIVREILVLEDTGDYRLSGKTGTGIPDTSYVGWFVGYLEENGNVYFFATNLESSLNPEAKGATAREITLEILQSLELLP
jgi:beta-lactamase class D